MPPKLLEHVFTVSLVIVVVLLLLGLSFYYVVVVDDVSGLFLEFGLSGNLGEFLVERADLLSLFLKKLFLKFFLLNKENFRFLNLIFLFVLLETFF